MIEKLRALFATVYGRVYWSKFGTALFAQLALWILASAILAPLFGLAIALHNLLPQAYGLIALIAYGLVFISGFGLAVLMEEASARAQSDRSKDSRIKKRDLENVASGLKGLYIAARNQLARMLLFLDRWTNAWPGSDVGYPHSPALAVLFGLTVLLPVIILFFLLPHSYRIISLLPVPLGLLMYFDLVATANRMRRQGKETGRFPWRGPKVVKPPSRETLEDYIDDEPPQAREGDKTPR